MAVLVTSASARLQAKIAAAQDIERSAMQLAEDLKYPVDAQGRVFDMNHLPDVLVTLVYHLTRCGWRKDESKQLIKQRRVVGAGFYEDLVTYVGVNDADEPLIVERNQQQTPQEWSVTPQVNMIDEPRPTE